MYKILIFGTGKYYQNRKNTVLTDEVIGFLDNDREKQHHFFDEKFIYAPDEIKEIEFDYILIMSVSFTDMRNQLLDMGVEDSKIIDYSNYHKIKPYTEMKVFCADNQKEIIEWEKLILLVSHELSNTGAPIVLYYMAKLLQKNGYYPVICSPKEGTLQKSILNDRIPLIISRELYEKNFILNLLLTKAKMTVFNTLEVGYLIADCSHICKKSIWWLHEGEASYRKVTVANCNKRYSSDVAIYAVSKLAENCFDKHSETNRISGILPYGIPDKGYKERKISGKIRFLLSGTVSIRKGQDIMMKAIHLLTEEELERSEFIFAGSVSEEDVYKKIQNCDLNQVVYKGLLNISEMQKLYENIDVVVCPSREDPLPVVLTEGMMNKRVCIMSDNTGTATMIKDKQEGLICEAGSAESLAEQMKWIIHNTDKLEAIAQAGRKVYENIFTMEAFEKRIMSLVDE